MKIDKLPQPYRELARICRSRQETTMKEWKHFNNNHVSDANVYTNNLANAFSWDHAGINLSRYASFTRHEFWNRCDCASMMEDLPSLSIDRMQYSKFFKGHAKVDYKFIDDTQEEHIVSWVGPVYGFLAQVDIPAYYVTKINGEHFPSPEDCIIRRIYDGWVTNIYNMEILN